MRKILAFILVIALLLPAAAFAGQERTGESFALAAGGASPADATRAVAANPFSGDGQAVLASYEPAMAAVEDFSFTDTNNTVHQLSDYADKYLVLIYGTIGSSDVKATLANMQSVLEATSYDNIVAVYFDVNSTSSVTPAQFATEFNKLGLTKIIACANDGSHMARAKQWYKNCLGVDEFPGANNPISFMLELNDSSRVIRYYADGRQSFDELASPLGKLVGYDVVGRPVMLQASIVDGTILLNWDRYGGEFYIVERSTLYPSSTTQLNTDGFMVIAAGLTENAFADYSASVNSAYLYRVQVMDSDEYSTPAYARLRVSTATDESAALAREAEYIIDLRRFDEDAALLLSGNADLNDAAQERAEECELLRDHYRPNGSWWTSVLTDRGIQYSKNVEFVGAANSAAELVENWFEIQNNLDYLLGNNYNCMGSGCYMSESGTIYYCVIFLQAENITGMQLPQNPYVKVEAESSSISIDETTTLTMSGAESYELYINDELCYSGTASEYELVPTEIEENEIKLVGTDRAGMKGEDSIVVNVEPLFHHLWYYADGELVMDITTLHGMAVQRIPDVPSKDGRSGVWSINLKNIPITRDYTINAIYADSIYTVEYWVEGKLHISYNVADGTALGEIPAVPAKDNYNAKWDIDLTGVPITQNRTVVAIYTPETCKVDFMVEGELYKSYVVKYGETLDLIPTVPTKDGRIGKWDVDLAGVSITSDRTVNAVYTMESYTVYYIIEDMVYRMYRVEHGKTLSEIPEVPHKDGFTGAWSKDLAGVPITAETFVFAVYEQRPFYGDADCSTIITAADAAAILRHLVDLDTLSAQGMLNADCDLSGVISAADAACILRYLVELEPSLPIVK